MSNKVYNKSIRRTITGSLGRFIAILAIIALGVGFFSGVKNCKSSMMLTCDKYVNDYKIQINVFYYIIIHFCVKVKSFGKLFSAFYNIFRIWVFLMENGFFYWLFWCVNVSYKHINTYFKEKSYENLRRF